MRPPASASPLFPMAQIYLLLQLVLVQLLQDKVDLLVSEQGCDVAPKVLTVVLSVVVTLPARVDT